MEINKKYIIGSLYGLGISGAVFITKIRIDPFTRGIIGLLSGLFLAGLGAYSRNKIIVGFGATLATGSGLQLFELGWGSKVIKNKYNQKIYVIKEDANIKEIKPLEKPSYRIEGLTWQGMNAVFKARNGVYVKIDKSGKINEVFGLGRIFNRVTGAGLLDKLGEKEKQDERWIKLMELSNNYK